MRDAEKNRENVKADEKARRGSDEGRLNRGALRGV